MTSARCLFLLPVIVLLSGLRTPGHSRIVPLRTTATYPSRPSGSNWHTVIKGTDGKAVYVLSLEPDFDVGHHLITLHLLLHRPGDKADTPNLLDPTGNRHGLQPYDFTAKYLAPNEGGPTTGEKRNLSIGNLGLSVQVVISKAEVSPISDGEYQLQIDKLELQIEVSNLEP